MTYYESFYEAVRLEGNAWMSRYTADVNEELRCVLITRTTPTVRTRQDLLSSR